MAFTKTVTEPVQTVAPWTCVRAVIESCALAAWLLDPNLDARTRVQRSFAFRYEGLIQQVKFGRASGNEAGTAKATARIDEVERVALGLGFSREKNLEPISIAFLCNKAANTFAKPIWYKCQLFGWDIEYLRGILDSAFTGLGLQRAGRQL